MKSKISSLLLMIVILSIFSTTSTAQQIQIAEKILTQKYDLVPKHSKDTQYYEMESRLQKHALDGVIQSVDVYRLQLRCVPSRDPAKKDEFTCLKFTVQVNNAQPVLIPSLVNWKYYFSITASDEDNKGQLFGIDHSKFEKLIDHTGKPLALENTYHVYNAFIDFHTMSVFSERTARDSGIQELKFIGDKIVHNASYSQPQVNLGREIAEGSYFKNGEITLFFKGLGVVNRRTCAIIEYDSGKSSFFMLMKPMRNMEVPTKGSSHYWGDIYKDLRSGWIQRAILNEVVISETRVPAANTKMNNVIERQISIQNIRKPGL
ncbi:MAG TPA: hypothetical protein VGD17_10445 [Chitinophagaceae bacterium]